MFRNILTSLHGRQLGLDAGGNLLVRGGSVITGYETHSPVTLGTVGAPTSGTLTVTPRRMGNFITLDMTLAAVRIPVTDAAGSGSFGSLVLWTWPQTALVYLGCRQDYTAFAEGSALTGGAGDARFDIGIGTVAKAAAADGALGGATDDDIGGEIDITLSSGTGTGTLVSALMTAVNGTASAPTINLNWSGTAATIDANSTIDVTGTISIAAVLLGDD